MKTNSLDFDAQALREKILDLAMRGKLVKQDPNDEPASVLLEKIKVEKAELVKEGKIKKNKALPEITDEEKPFDIPDSWEWVRLGDIVFNCDGQRIPVSISDRRKRKKIYDYYGASGKIDKIDSYLFSRPMLLISEDGANLLARTKPIAFIATGKYWVNNHAHVMDSIDINILNFLANYINSQNLNMYITGSAQPKLNQQNLNKIIVPFPPLSEQSRIAAKIAQLFALLHKVESSTQQYIKLQTLLKSKVLDLAMRGKLVKQDPNDEPASVLLEKIKAEKEQLIKEKKIKKSKPLPPITDEEKPFDIPDSWEWVRLGDYIEILRGGSPRPIKNYLTNDPDGINWIKIGDSVVGSKYIVAAKEKIVKAGLAKTREVHVGDFLLSNSMSFGRPYILKIDGAVHDGWLIMRNYKELFYKDYLYYLLSSTYIRRQFENIATGSTVKNLNKDRVANTLGSVPPLNEQKRITRRIKQIYEQIDNVV